MRAWLLFLALAAGLRAGPVPDAPVLTDDGRSVHFLTDVVAGKTAIINFIYTDCGGMCPMQGRNFAILSRALGDRLTKDVVLISVTIAPAVDTPSKLARWKNRYSTDPGWVGVTGDPASISPLLQSLIGDISPQTGHDGTAVIFHPAPQRVEKINGLGGPGEIMKRLGPPPQ